MALFRWGRDQSLECFRRGKEAADREDLDLAFSWFTEAIRVDPSHYLGFLGRGFILLKRAEYDGAITDFSEALRLRAEDPVTYFFRSLCYEGKGDEERRRADCEKAIALDPTLEERLTAFRDQQPCGEALTQPLAAKVPPGLRTSIQGTPAPAKEFP